MRARFWFPIATLLALSACKVVLGLGDPQPMAEEPDGHGGSPDATKDAAPNDPGSNDCKADLTSDSANCGRCGHDCGRGKCSARQCEPFVLAKLPQRIEDIVADATNLYVTQSTAPIARVSKTTGESAPLPAASGAYALARSGPELYWSTYWSEEHGEANVVSCLLPNCTGKTTLAQVGSELYGVVESLVGATGFGGKAAVAWLDRGRGQVAVPGPLSSSSQVLAADAQTAESGKIHLVGDTLYWSETGGNLIGSLKRGETAPRHFDIAPYQVVDFAITGTTILFGRTKFGGESGRGAVLRGTLGNGTVDAVDPVADTGFVERILLDGNALLVLTEDALLTCPANDCKALTVLVSDPAKDAGAGGFAGLEVDETTIWFGSIDGTVYGLAK